MEPWESQGDVLSLSGNGQIGSNNSLTMDVDEHHSDDSMPDLQSVSNSSDSDRDAVIADDDGDSDWSDVDEMPPLEPTAPSSGLRRRHEDTDQDADRDRRHPSQRASQVNPPPVNPNPPQVNVNPPPVNPNIPQVNVNGPQHLAQLFNLLTRGIATAANANDIPFGPDMFFGAPPPPPKDSPANAARIVAGLERVPEGLVRRLERVSALNSSGGDDGLGAVGGDSGCAICWDRLLDGDGAAFATTTTTTDDSTSATTNADDSTSATTTTDDSTKEEANTIIALPCAHTFHAACLLPWFARPGQTTCPTCRFDVDPEGAIWFGGRKGRRHGFAPAFGGVFPGPLFDVPHGPHDHVFGPHGHAFGPPGDMEWDEDAEPEFFDGDPEVEAEFFDGNEGDFGVGGPEMAFDLVMEAGGGIGVVPVGGGMGPGGMGMRPLRGGPGIRE
ncbi:hypothetical protein B0H16DRAFT_731812 [Mycena metata]|uniref:RING-type domain-containing protein n=1 Tax=Mycena metata TaxID=1033252 RepID=A0AAD7NBT9_9AGAR|nr:hypothetical protein B0H16DRAFT_731812 [Mycena metata]